MQKPKPKLNKIPTQLTEDIDLMSLSFYQLLGLLDSINYKVISTSKENYVFNKKLKIWNYEVVQELNLRAYEYKLYKKNLPNLGLISRPKYNRLVLFSKLIMDDIFIHKEKFSNLKLIIS